MHPERVTVLGTTEMVQAVRNEDIVNLIMVLCMGEPTPSLAPVYCVGLRLTKFWSSILCSTYKLWAHKRTMMGTATTASYTLDCIACLLAVFPMISHPRTCPQVDAQGRFHEGP